MARIRMLISNFIEAKEWGEKTGEFDIAQISDDSFEQYYILLKPLSGIYKDQYQVIELSTSYGQNSKYHYPINPPLVKFVTRVLHSNISVNGSICLDILKDNSKWSPMYSIKHVIYNIILLYLEPNDESPFNSTASAMHRKCMNMFKKCERTNMSMDDEESMREVCFMSFQQATNKYATSDLKKYAKWFPQLINGKHSAESIESIKSLRIMAQSYKPKAKSIKNIKKKKNRSHKKWAKYRE